MTKKTSYGIIETIGGFVMARSYRHIQQYEREILELKEKGLTVSANQTRPFRQTEKDAKI